MKNCEYELLAVDDPIYMIKKYYIRLYFKRHLCLQIEINKNNYDDILAEEQNND